VIRREELTGGLDLRPDLDLRGVIWPVREVCRSHETPMVRKLTT